jgi:hypothetical protein
MQIYDESTKKETTFPAPSYSIGGQLRKTAEKPANHDQKSILFVDKFEITTKGNWLPFDDDHKPIDIVDYGDIVLQRDEDLMNGTRHYKYVYNLYLDAEKFATILTHPRSDILDGDLSQLKIENCHLYRQDWKLDLKYILEGLNVKIQSFTNIDIAADGGNFIQDHKRMVLGEYRNTGRATFATHFTRGGKVEGFTIGKKSSEKFIRGYSKTSEIKKRGGKKEYINKVHETNGLHGDVERLEISMRAKAVKRIKGFDWTRLDDQSYLAGIMEIQLKNFYQFVQSYEYWEKKDVSRCKKINAVDLSKCLPEYVEKLVKVDRRSALYLVKQKLRYEMMRIFVEIDEVSPQFVDQIVITCFALADEYGLRDWFVKRCKDWRKDFEFQMLLRDAYRGKKHPAAPKKAAIKEKPPLLEEIRALLLE